MIDADIAREWCVALAKRLPKQDIRRTDAPYLMRYFAAGWNPFNAPAGPAVFLHHFVASDPLGAVHSHPWRWGCSLILFGGYIEHRCVDGVTSARRFLPGDVNVLLPNDHHRVELITTECWSLFLAGTYQQPWTFSAECP